MKVLRWPKSAGSTEVAPHELRIVQQHDRVKLLLLIEKSGIAQHLTLEVTIQDESLIESAWNRQGSRWRSFDTVQGDLFYDLRVIDLGTNCFIVWRVDHRSGTPYDLLDFFSGSEAELRAFYARKK